MKRGLIGICLLAGVLVIGLAACSAPGTAANPTPAPAKLQATVAPQPTIAPVESASSQQLDLGISGSGEIKAVQDADLVFGVIGTVAQVQIKEGDNVKKGDLLAILDTRTFDQQVQQAEAVLASARAQEAALTEEPRAADLAAAEAQVRQAQAAIDSIRSGPKVQDIQAAEAGLNAAKANLQATRDRLSLGKTQASSQMQSAALTLTQAQARYAQAKYNWEYASDSGNDPIVPKVTTSTGKQVENKLSDGQLENYYAQFVAAEAGMNQAAEGLQLAQVASEGARQAEVTGIAAAEQQVIQAQSMLDKLRLPPDKAQLAAAQAGLAQAQAGLERLKPNPRDSQKAQVAAMIAQAQAGLEQARINRERAELRAPFDGIVSKVNIDPGDQSAAGGQPPIKLVDVSTLHVDVQISDIDIVMVQIGQIATIRVDAAPSKTYNGKISYIAPVATTVGTIRTYLVRVTLDNQEGLLAGMSAQVDITK